MPRSKKPLQVAGAVAAISAAMDRGRSQMGVARRIGVHRSVIANLLWAPDVPDARVYVDTVARVAVGVDLYPAAVIAQRSRAGAWPAGLPFDDHAFTTALRAGLYQARVARRIGEKTAAKYAGIPQSWVSRMEGSDYRINLATLYRYVHALGITGDEFAAVLTAAQTAGVTTAQAAQEAAQALEGPPNV